MNMNNQIQELFEKNKIEGVVFDLDSTLTDTKSWLLFMYKRFSTAITPYINNKYKLSIDIEDFTQAYYQSEFIEYKNGNINFVTRFPGTLSRITTSLEIDIDEDDVVEKFSGNIKEIYTLSAEPFDGTLQLLHTLLPFTKVAICTHSGKDWTKIKIDDLKSKYKEQYGNTPDIYSYSIDINKPKDTSEWTKVAKGIDSLPKNLIAVGDNFDADISPAVKAGYKYLVWITENSNAKKKELGDLRNQGYKISTIENISELEKTLTSNQPFEDI